MTVMNLNGSIRLNKLGVLALIVLATVVVLVYRNTAIGQGLNHHKTGSGQESELISLKELLSAAIDAAVRGGHEVRRIREEATLNMKSKGKTKEGVNDPVTDGDMKSHIVMFYSMQKAFPGLEIVSEEHDASNVDASVVSPASVRDAALEEQLPSDTIVYLTDVTVWIDPLDATKEYTEDLRKYVTTMVGVAVKGVPTLGVVHRPFTNVTHWGWLGHGVSTDLQAIKQQRSQVPDAAPAPVSAPRIVVSISHQGSVQEVAQQAFGADTEILLAAGAGYKILEVIRGNADVYVHTSLIKKWDLCAGHAILSSMGGTLTTLSGGEITYDDRTAYKHETGLLATASAANHSHYVEKFMILMQEKKKEKDKV